MHTSASLFMSLRLTLCHYFSLCLLSSIAHVKSALEIERYLYQKEEN